MILGNLVRYRSFPHSELHKSGMTGVIVGTPRLPHWTTNTDAPLVVDVVWSMNRGRSYPAGTPVWDYVDDLEVVK